MSASRHYDTVAFDVRDNATMLFFARTSAAGDIEDYLLLMRTIGEDFDDTIFHALDMHTAVERRDVVGGPARGRVASAIAELRGRLQARRDS